MDVTALVLTAKLAFCTTAILFALGLPLAYWLVVSNWRGLWIVEVCVTLPLVLPPTVLGFYLLWLAGPTGLFGKAVSQTLGIQLIFSFPGILLASVLYNLPFAVRPFMHAIASVPKVYWEASESLGCNRLATFWRVILPLAWPGIFGGLVLVFAHTVGEFGVVLMVGGNLPGLTRTLSISLYDSLQALEFQAAHQTAAALLMFSFAVLALTHLWLRRTWRP